ncbi:hypothetical protein GGR56DRAFT_661653 [Xylariaceae sp. FL0804]|nr:hypothetical protein GGR56DRAFT_661653 [Xylariaceae sp. FL0804]
MDSAGVESWLSRIQPTRQASASASASPETVDDYSHLNQRQKRKRRELARDLATSSLSQRIDSHVPSPPSSRDAAKYECDRVMNKNKNKRRKTAAAAEEGEEEGQASMEAEEDDVATPTQKRISRALPPGSETSYSSRQSSSRRSGLSSPRKKLAGLEVRDDGVMIRQFDGDASPGPRFQQLWHAITTAKRGVGIISEAQKESLSELSRRSPAWSFPPIHDLYFSKERAALGPTPTADQVLAIQAWTRRLIRQDAEEAAWNSGVHHRVLELAFHGGQGGPSPEDGDDLLVDFIQCTSAGIIKQYLAMEAPSKKVDFVICLQPKDAAERARTMARPTESAPSPTSAAAAAAEAARLREAAARIDKLCEASPFLSINHTDSPPLLLRPVAVSVETKRPVGDANEANLQIGTWQAAQWNKLIELIEDREDRSADDDVADPLSTLEFLPGIIIRGQDWYFVATSRAADNRKKTILWREERIGSTGDVVEIYAIIYVVQLLKRWVSHDYWPWYQREVLGMRPMAQEIDQP